MSGIIIDRNVIRFLEARLCLYSAVLGAMFLTIPQSFAGYVQWAGVAPIGWWGAVLLTASALHLIALRINGLLPFATSIVRALGAFTHLSVLLPSAIFYADLGAWWGVLSLATLSLDALMVAWWATGTAKGTRRNAD